MSRPVRCLFLLFVLGACSKAGDERPLDGGSGSSGKGGGGGSSQEAGGAGSAADGGGSGAGSAADSGTSAGAAGCSANCELGEHCELVDVTCVRAPCPPLPMCVPDSGARDPAQRDCDPRKVLCKRTAPECPELQVPSVEGSCYGECVDVHACQCTGPEACPLPEKYTCNMSAKHCTPYLR